MKNTLSHPVQVAIPKTYSIGVFYRNLSRAFAAFLTFILSWILAAFFTLYYRSVFLQQSIYANKCKFRMELNRCHTVYPGEELAHQTFLSHGSIFLIGENKFLILSHPADDIPAGWINPSFNTYFFN